MEETYNKKQTEMLTYWAYGMVGAYVGIVITITCSIIF